MPGRGFPPEPDAVRLLKGKRPRFTAQTDTGARATCPADLSVAARKIWHRHVRELRCSGRLTSLDREAFAAYCTCMARFLECEAEIDRLGLLLPGPRGCVVKNPLSATSRSYLDAACQWADRIGLSPRARVALPEPTTKPADALEVLLG
jgi:P27 family predicted phage terminase small subunit